MITNYSKNIFIFAILFLTICRTTSACYGTLLVSGITAEEKQIILQEHNRLRQLVATGRYPGQPGAENMREIVWDDELAARAQKWADNCQFRHDPFRTINRFTMGQNLAIIWSTAPLDPDDGDFPSRIQSWFNEVQKYSFGDAWSPKTGHYSQLVWGETSLIGCGYSEYKDSYKYNKLYVCNYGPGGNVVGFNPYEVGKPSCATYGLRPSPRYAGLCATPGTESLANGLISNNFETYEYKQTNTFNNKPNAITTQYPQKPKIPSHSQIPSSKYPQQAKTIAQADTSVPASVSNSVPNSKIDSTASATAEYKDTTTTLLSKKGSSYGNAAYGGSSLYTTEPSQYKYKNKLEAYKPSQAEFQKSVLKHTILRTHLNDKIETKAKDEQISEMKPEVVATVKPATRGWSLLTWRG